VQAGPGTFPCSPCLMDQDGEFCIETL